MKKIFLCIILLLTGACSAQSPDVSEKVSFIDDRGVQVEVTKKPQRTAVLMGSYADIWLNAGGDIIASVQDALDRGLIDEETAIVGSGKEVDRKSVV